MTALKEFCIVINECCYKRVSL